MISERRRKQKLEIYRELKEERISQEEGGRRLLEIDPNHGPALLYIAAARVDAGDLDEAETLMWKALELMPSRHLPYLSLLHLLSTRNPNDPRLRPLQILAMWKLSGLDEIPAHEVEIFKQLDAPGVDFTDPDSYGMLAHAMEEHANTEPEPSEVTEQLLPYRLLNELQLEAEGGLDDELMDRIQHNARRCIPIFRAAVRDWIDHPDALSPMSVELIMAMLGEISGPEALEELIELADSANSEVFVHANWAIWRLGRRFPAEVLERLRSTIADARLTQLCAIAEQMHLLPDTDGLAAGLVQTLDRLPEFANDPDAPHLLAVVATALFELGLEDEAGEVMRVHQHKLSAKGRRDFKRLFKTQEGYVPRLQSERIDEFDIQEVCRDLALMNDPEKEDDEEVEEEEQHAPPPDDFSVLVRALMDASHEWRTREQMEGAFRLFFGPSAQQRHSDDLMAGFVEWYLYDFRPGRSGATIAEQYLKRNGASLTARSRALLEALCAAKFGLREVIRIEDGVGVELRDVFTGEQMFVHDVTSSKALVRWDCVLNRVFYFDGRWQFSGNGVLVPRNLLDQVMDRVREGAQAAGQKPEDYVRNTSHEWARTVADMQQQTLRDVRVVNAEGDELEISSATYQVLDEAKAVAALAATKVFEETTSPKDPPGQRNFGWLETGIEGPRRAYGHIEMQHGMLKLECNSRKRLSIGRQLVEKHAGEFLKHLTDQFQSMDDVKESALRGDSPRFSGAGPKPEEIPREVQEQFLLQYKAKHYATWPDIPVPALEGRTPREAMRSEVGRRKVEELLRSFENDEERARKRGDPAFDFAPLRKELGL